MDGRTLADAVKADDADREGGVARDLAARGEQRGEGHRRVLGRVRHERDRRQLGAQRREPAAGSGGGHEVRLVEHEHRQLAALEERLLERGRAAGGGVARVEHHEDHLRVREHLRQRRERRLLASLLAARLRRLLHRRLQRGLLLPLERLGADAREPRRLARRRLTHGHFPRLTPRPQLRERDCIRLRFLRRRRLCGLLPRRLLLCRRFLCRRFLHRRLPRRRLPHRHHRAHHHPRRHPHRHLPRRLRPRLRRARRPHHRRPRHRSPSGSAAQGAAGGPEQRRELRRELRRGGRRVRAVGRRCCGARCRS
mmetsp:Transcript_59137/g.155617  ORF Transcript_59137/g.155617 Transcript_59137/m.155617 type:complete len:310 (+) Transcript_59137:1964-2893(+)